MPWNLDRTVVRRVYTTLRIEVSKQDLAGRSVESYTLAMDSDGHLQKRGSRTEYNDKAQPWRRYRVTGVDGGDTETLLSSTYYV